MPAGDLSQWTHPPFAGIVEDGFLHGRGAADMKGTVAAQAMTLILLQRLGVPLEHGVGFVCVADEEAGGAYGAGWSAATHPERFRARCCLCEGGGSFVQLDGRDWCLLGVGEKGRYEVTAMFRGRGAHAARPWQGENAFFKVADALARLRDYEPERDVAAPIFDTLARAQGPVTAATVDSVIARLASSHGRLADHLRQVSRLVITPTLVVGRGEVEQRARRVPSRLRRPRAAPTGTGVRRGARRASAGRGRRPGRSDRGRQPVGRAPGSRAVFGDALRDALGRDADVVPTLSGGFTDSRFVRELGVPAYGFAPGHPESDPSKHRAHGPNESVAMRDLVVQTATYLGIAHRLAAAR